MSGTRSGSSRICRGRHTAFTNGTLLGKRLATQGFYPWTRISIDRDRLRVRAALSGSEWTLAKADVELVGLVPDGHHLSFRSVGFLLRGGGTWEVMLGPPKKLLGELERNGWPVDRDAILSWDNVAECARPSPG